ncbi:Aspartic proteinase nepenthesin-2 [Nymphaea thermarum]|nr:Aspartic proteinase nepenthesin-2 [Nymphaea thermarum]
MLGFHPFRALSSPTLPPSLAVADASRLKSDGLSISDSLVVSDVWESPTVSPSPRLGTFMISSVCYGGANAQHYYVALHGISVGGKRLPIPESVFQFSSDGSGGVVVDSGSTFTGLAEEAYRKRWWNDITKVTNRAELMVFLRSRNIINDV